MVERGYAGIGGGRTQEGRGGGSRGCWLGCSCRGGRGLGWPGLAEGGKVLIEGYLLQRREAHDADRPQFTIATAIGVWHLGLRLDSGEGCKQLNRATRGRH